MTTSEIVKLIEELSDKYEVLGIRSDKAGYQVGHVFDNSCQWWQDWQEEWGEMPEDYNADPEHPFNRFLGCWWDGDLDGVCAVGIDSYRLTESAVEKALESAKTYDNESLYLVGGFYWERGNDIDEVIIRNGVCLAVIE